MDIQKLQGMTGSRQKTGSVTVRRTKSAGDAESLVQATMSLIRRACEAALPRSEPRNNQ